MAQRICLINQKGGCGKSSLCFHLSGALARMGMSVLLIDCDPQGSLSQGVLGPAFVESLDLGDTVAGLFDESSIAINHLPAPIQTPVRGIQLLPANLHLAAHNFPQPERSGLLQFMLRDYVSEQNGFDIVLFDCPPNLYQCTWNSLLAASHVVIPVPPEDFGTQGLSAVHQAVASARRLNPELELLGHVINRRDRRLLVHRAYENQLRELYADSVFSTVISEASAFKVALSSRLPVSEFSSRSKAAQQIAELADEMLDRASGTDARLESVA